jgi:membrane associated rhomboid family serine protease
MRREVDAMRPRTPLGRAASFPVTVGLIGAAVALSIAAWLGRDIGKLVVTEEAFFEEPWRLVTSTLPHQDIVHLAFNAYWLWVFGTYLEERLRAPRFLGLVLLTAVVSGAAEYGAGIGGIGLSGVGYGLVGFLYGARRRDPSYEDAIDRKTVQLFVGWFFFCIGTTLAKLWPVGNVAHGTGALVGLVLSVAAISPPAATPRKMPSAFGWLATALLLGASLLSATTLRPHLNFSPDAGLELGAKAHAALLANRNAEAVTLFERAVKLSPKEPTLWFNLGIAYQRLGRVADCQRAYRRAAELEPTNADYQRAADGAAQLTPSASGG